MSSSSPTPQGWWRRHWKGSLAAAIVVILGVTVVAPFVFLHIIEGPPPPSLSLAPTVSTTASGSPSTSASPTASTSSSSLSGTWGVAKGSQVEYRLAEILFGLSATAVGISSAVTGSMTISGTRHVHSPHGHRD